jgi:LysR family transcriptional regulator, transcriptional activator of the cysJI operon
MTLRHLAVFTAVADADCSVTKAAETMHIAQPAVSQTIADLESYYGLRLFDRLNHRLYLTPAGEKLLSYARRLVDNFNQIDEIMKNSEVALPLRIGASFTVSCVLLPEIMHRFSAFSADVTVCNTADLEKQILASTLDAAIVEGTIASSDIIQTVLADDTLVCAAAPLYAEKLKNINNATFILREEGSGTRIQSDAMLAAAGYAPHVWSIANTQSIIELVKAGTGATIISRVLISRELSEGTLQEYAVFSAEAGSRTFRLVYHKDKYIDTRMNAFIDACRK